MRTAEPAVLSLYLKVPLDPVEQRELRARADGLIRKCRSPVPQADREAVAALLAARGWQWLGKSVAIFASTELQLLEALPMRCELPERAALDTHPHVRPLLTAMRRCPAYQVAVSDTRHGWLMAVDGDAVSVTTVPDQPADRDRRFGGWYGLDSYRVQQRVIQHTRRHYRDIAMLLRDPARSCGPVVIGGHAAGIPELLRMLPDQVRARYAGSFTADLHTLTSARARELADQVVDRWAGRQEEQLVREARSGGTAIASGLPDCLAAVNAGAVGTLLVPDDMMLPGFECGRCEALSLTGNDCPDLGAAARPVPDLMEEMTCRVLDDKGTVVPIASAGFPVAARLRFPLPSRNSY